jgi:hypothetical protein
MPLGKPPAKAATADQLARSPQVKAVADLVRAQPRQLASPNGTAEVEVARKGVMVSTVSVKNRGVPMRTVTSYTNIDIEDPGPDHAVVDAGHHILQNVEYQSVTSTVRVTIPVRIDAKAIKAGFKTAWAIVEEELIERSKFATETVKALAQIKRETEGH